MAKPKKQTEAKPVRVFDPPWLASAYMATMGQAAVDGVDAVAGECEKIWGVGRLRLLVSDELRAKFDSQALKFNDAIRNADVTELTLQCARMSLAWRTLHKAAQDAGALPLDPDVWEVGLKDGTVAVIVRGNPEAHHVLREGRATNVYTLAEIAELIHGFPQIVKAKEVWPGATVVRAGQRDPLQLDELPNDAIPF